MASTLLIQYKNREEQNYDNQVDFVETDRDTLEELCAGLGA